MRHSPRLQTLASRCARCTQRVHPLLLFLCVAITLFSPLVHGLRMSPGRVLSSPASQPPTRAVISMTTVGYGEHGTQQLAWPDGGPQQHLSGSLMPWPSQPPSEPSTPSRTPTWSSRREQEELQADSAACRRRLRQRTRPSEGGQ